MKRLILISLVLTGCGIDESSNDHKRVRVVDAGPTCSEEVSYGSYGKYVVEFKDMVAKATGVRPKDRLKSIAYRTESQEHILATCYTQVAIKSNEILGARIELDPNMANKGMVLERVVVFHELGHCIMNDDHVADETDLMNPTTSITITAVQADARIAHYMARLAKGE